MTTSCPFDINGKIDTATLAFLTADEPGISGLIKQRPTDFMVTEIPIDEPAGSGDHLHLFIEKENRLTTDVSRMLARHFGVPVRNIGYAGLKDKHAITRQWFSVEHVTEEHASRFQAPNVRLLFMDRHPTKLRRGVLKGNRFIIRIRNVQAGQVLAVDRILRRLHESGVPNFYGEQRFGYRRDNHLQGRFLLLGDCKGFLDQLLGRPCEPSDVNHEARQAYEKGDYLEALRMWRTVHRFERQALGPLLRKATHQYAVEAIDKSHRFLLISAFQSAVFNRLLDARLRSGELDQLLPGDVAYEHAGSRCFRIQDPAEHQPRCTARELSPTGPMWGKTMLRAEQEIARRELDELLAAGVTEELLCGQGPYEPQGARRAFRFFIDQPSVEAGGDEHGPFIQVQFELPRGCYATVVLREIMKNNAPLPAGEEG